MGEGLIALTVVDFQRHAKVKIAFDPHVTIIIGASDKGKSSLLRALGCLAIGEPDGQDLIRHDSDGYKIKLEVPGHTVIRKRGKGGNYYVLDGVKLTRDRGDWPPPQVMNAVRLCPQNFQWQLDGPLWFLDSAGQVAKQLNEVVDLEAIDAVLSAANSEAKAATAKHEGSVQEYEAAKHDYQNLKWVPAMVAAWERCEERLAKVEKTAAAKDKLVRQVARLREAETLTKPLENLADDWSALSEKHTTIYDTRRKIAGLRSVLSRLAKLKRQADAVDAFRDSWNALCELRAAAERKGQQIGQLREAINQLEDLQREADRWQSKLEEAERAVAEVKVCPACGQPTNLPSSRRSSAPTYTCQTNRPPRD